VLPGSRTCWQALSRDITITERYLDYSYCFGRSTSRWKRFGRRYACSSAAEIDIGTETVRIPARRNSSRRLGSFTRATSSVMPNASLARRHARRLSVSSEVTAIRTETRPAPVRKSVAVWPFSSIRSHRLCARGLNSSISVYSNLSWRIVTHACRRAPRDKHTNQC